MSNRYERFSQYNPYITINKDIDEARQSSKGDVDQPFNILDWIINTGSTFGSPDEYVENHVQYVKDWYKTNKTVGVYDKKQVTNNYVKFLREVLLVYNNQEEARYLMNLDWSDPLDLELAVPYFSSRLREIIMHVVEYREKIRFEKVRNSFKGGVAGTKKFIYDVIINALTSEKYYIKYGKKLPTPKQVARDLNINIDEKYNSYQSNASDGGAFNQAPSAGSFNYKIFPDFDAVVIDLLKSLPVTLASESDAELTVGNLALTPTLTANPDDISSLPHGEFTNFIKSKSNLNLHQHKKWIEKYSGTDMYYISAGHDASTVKLDKLYNATSKTMNHLSVTTPSIVYGINNTGVPARVVGGFYLNTGVTHAYSLNLSYKLNTLSLSGGDIYESFPDPAVYQVESPHIIQLEDVTHMKADTSNDFLYGDIVNSKRRQKFYPYQSEEETNMFPKTGISKNTDNFDFWRGDKKDKWNNADLYPIDLTYNYGPATRERVKDLLLGDKSVVKWRTDVFGNDYALLKPANRPKVHKEPEPNPEALCRVLDGSRYWDDTTYIVPQFTDHVDGAPSFRCYGLNMYVDYAYGGYFKPYTCDAYTCYEPNYVEYEPCPSPYVLSGHKVTDRPEVLECIFKRYTQQRTKNKPSEFSMETVFKEWDRISANKYYKSSPDVDWSSTGAGANSWVWDPALQSAIQTENTVFNAFITPDSMKSVRYRHTAVLQSFNSDDDHNGLIAACVTRPNPYYDPTMPQSAGNYPLQYKALVLGRSLGGAWPTRLRAIDPVDGLEKTSDNCYGVGMIDWGMQSVTGNVVGIGTVGFTEDYSGNWEGTTTAVEVVREDNIITFRCSRLDRTGTLVKFKDHDVLPESLIELDLTSHPLLVDFLEPTAFGFCNSSQSQSLFLDASAFQQPPPPKPIEFDIYDLTTCNPKRYYWSQKKLRWLYNPEEDVDLNNVVIVDRDGCGSYGFDCYGRCLNTPPSAGDSTQKSIDQSNDCCEPD